MDKTKSLASFYEEIEKASLKPLWEILPKYTGKTLIKTKPYLWKWNKVYDLLEKAGELLNLEEGGERRALSFTNPGLFEEGNYTLRTLSAHLQMIMPGETALSHRHTPTALRFVIRARGGYTAMEGEKFPMEDGDLILAPSWAWHGHGNDGKEPTVWLDCLDVPLVNHLQMRFQENYPNVTEPLTKPVGYTSDLVGRSFLRPAWQDYSQQNYPVVYKWKDSYGSLKNLEDAEGSPFDGIALEYMNPITGGSALRTISCWLQMIRPGEKTKSHRHTMSVIYHVVSGEGATVIDGERFQWAKGDILALPPWSLHSHENTSKGEATLFSVNDSPILKALGLSREEQKER
jgi:gentisate 1,2-dioxygenase